MIMHDFKLTNLSAWSGIRKTMSWRLRAIIVHKAVPGDLVTRPILAQCVKVPVTYVDPGRQAGCRAAARVCQLD